MYFSSLPFGLFFLIIFIFRWKLPSRYVKYLILAANLFFCLMFGVECLICAICITVITYFSGRLIDGASEHKKRNKYTMVSVLIVVLSLAFMKYASVYGGSSFSGILPVGMSFYCFRCISYLSDVYKGMQADNDSIHFINYSLFFPGFTSGPIDRYSDLSSQLSSPIRTFDYEMASSGIMRFLIGLFKKSVVAGHMALYTNWIYGDIRSYTGFTLLLTSFFYTVQIYCDFSGYSDMAIGLSEMLGFKIKDNFKHPYLAQSSTDFWNRWHISLSTWLRDYVYIPLGGNRRGKARRNVNLIITFLVSGIWHGATLNFLIWGGVHGLASVGERYLPQRERGRKYIRILRQVIAFAFINFTWVIFRLTKICDIGYFFGHIFDGINDIKQYVMSTQQILHIDYLLLIKLILMIIAIYIYDLVDERVNLNDRLTKISSGNRVTIYTVAMIVIFLSLPVEAATEYIYCHF